MAFLIAKQFRFSASHQLDHLADDHQCARLHGHNYTVEVIMQSGVLDADSFVRDFGALKPIQRFIDEKLDHRHLNDVMVEFEECIISALSIRSRINIHQWIRPSDEEVSDALRTTSENLARALYYRFKPDFPNLHAVRVSETPTTWAQFSEDQH